MGGAERMILWLAGALRDRGNYDVRVAALVGGSELCERADEAGLGADHLRFRGFFDPAGIARLVRLIRRERIDIVQTHGLRADAVARWAGRLGGARAIVSTIHSIDPWRRRPHVLLDRVTGPFVSRYVAVCEAAKAASVAREKIDPARIDVVPIGIPPRDIPRADAPAIRARLGVAPHAFCVGILANLRDMKGHRDVVEALPAILAGRPDCVFLFAGRDDSGGEIARLARERGVEGAIRFLGYYRETPELLAVMDAFMLPSTWEGFPVSILEALHAGVPVVASRVGGIPEQIEDGVDGLLIEPRSPGQIAEIILRLAADPGSRERLGAAGAARAVRDFGLEAMAGRMESVYGRVLARG